MSDINFTGDHYIAGRWTTGSERIDVTSPINGDLLGSVAMGSPADVDTAVSAARQALGAWSISSQATRSSHMRSMAQYISTHASRFAWAECLDTGFLLNAAEKGLVRRAAMNFNYYAEFADKRMSEPVELDRKGALNIVQYRPAGVVAVITPWNAPLVLATWKIAAAMAAGNTVVLKPAELAPLSCALLAEAAHATGLPAGVLNVVHGSGAVVGAALAAHAGIDRLAFTGSTATARRIGVACAESITPVSFELGGKSALIVCADSDLEAACAQVLFQFNHAGQICAAGTRILVEASIEAHFKSMVLERLPGLKVGDPREAKTAIGPVISDTQLARIEGLVDRARAAGAIALCGGSRHAFGPLYYAPTILTDVRRGSEIHREEVFGPVLLWSSFSSDDDAVDQANDSVYGLGAYLWCRNSERAMRIASRVRAGTVWVNGSTRDLDAPFGGIGQSGIGREGGLWGWEFFCDVVNVALKHGGFGPAEGSPTANPGPLR